MDHPDEQNRQSWVFVQYCRKKFAKDFPHDIQHSVTSWNFGWSIQPTQLRTWHVLDAIFHLKFANSPATTHCQRWLVWDVMRSVSDTMAMYVNSASLQCPCQGYALAESTECSFVLRRQLLRLGVVSMHLVWHPFSYRWAACWEEGHHFILQEGDW